MQQKDPGNERAQQLLDEIAKQFATQAQTALTEKRFDDAAKIDEQGLNAAPKDAGLLALQSRIAQARTDAQSQAASSAQKTAQQQTTRDTVEKLLATSSFDDLRAALTELSPLLADDADGKDTLALRTRAIDAIGKRLEAADNVADFDATAALLKDHEKDFGSDDAYAALAKKIPQLREMHVASTQGDLVLNATPWAKVESVVDADQHPMALPADATTPLVLNVPAGDYQITFKHPSGKTIVVSGKVEAKKRAVANAAFGSITSQEYFSRAGW